ncbi:Thg1 C terminal domain-containing protein [Lipomyces orientalis]|uniref:Thg1 C terminal domain-containing protein n=1 Tax=Lipomyces orientalis TaxID=1233043 RepID=A0ACC3TLF2_9ASCO
MAKSRFEYVRTYEQDGMLLPNTYIVIRLDGRGFHRFADRYHFGKPNDKRALCLMNAAAKQVMGQIPDIAGAYGQSDEYSFVLRRECRLFDRREAKLVSTFASTFTAHYQFLWPQYFPQRVLDGNMLPTFDARAVLYPSLREVRDYFSWRQADCHINNLYNTAFWTLVLTGDLSQHDAEQALMGTNSGDKNELLFGRFGINYNNEDAMFRKGTMLVRDVGSSSESAESRDEPEPEPEPEQHEKSKRQVEREEKKRRKAEIVEMHVDIIGDEFWKNSARWIS